MEENIKNENKNNQQHFAWKVLGIFAFVAILICSFVFIFNYNRAYDDNAGGGWLPPSFGVIVWHFLLAIVFIFVAIVLKIALRKRVRIWMLLLASVLIPIICYNFNYRALGKDGILYPLVDKGGIFHFIIIEDYNFDGITDKYYEIETQKRTIEDTCDDGFHRQILSVTSKTTGVGYIDSNYVLIQHDELYDFYYRYSCSPKNKYDKVVFDVTFREFDLVFHESDLAEKITIYMVDIETKERTPLKTERLNETTLRFEIPGERFNYSDDGHIQDSIYFDLR